MTRYDPASPVRQADLEEIRAVLLGMQHQLGTQPARPPVTPATATNAHAATAKSMYGARRKRAEVFGENADIFHEPAWDILLDLYVQRSEGWNVSVTSACIAAAVSATTGLRWISTLEARGLLERAEDPFDRRRSYIKLSAAAAEAMEKFFDLIGKLRL